MASNTKNLYPQGRSFVPSQSAYPPGNSFMNTSNMGLGMQQYPVRNINSGPLVNYEGGPLQVPPGAPVYNAPPPGFGMPLSTGYPVQPTYPGYFLSNENVSKATEDSWGRPPPYMGTSKSSVPNDPPPSSSGPFSTTGLVSATRDSLWNQTAPYTKKSPDHPLIDKRKEVDLPRPRRSRSRSRSKESRKCHKKKSKKHSRSPVLYEFKTSKKQRNLFSSPEHDQHSVKKPKMVIDPNRIPTPPPPPILRNYDNSNKKSTQVASESVANETMSLSSLLEAAMETSGVGKSQVSNPKVKKEILSNCETKIRELYKKRISGLEAFIPDPVEARQKSGSKFGEHL